MGSTEPTSAASGEAAATPPPSVPPPRSATGALTGLAGLFALVVSLVLMRDWLQPVSFRALVVATAALAMTVGIQLVQDTSQPRDRAGPDPTPAARAAPRPAQAGRLLDHLRRRCGGLSGPSRICGHVLCPVQGCRALAAAWPRGRLPILHRLGRPPAARPRRCLCAAWAAAVRRHASRQMVAAHGPRARLAGEGILPAADVRVPRQHAQQYLVDRDDPLDRFDLIFPHVLDALYLLDVLIAVIGYSLTLRALDTQVRSVDATVLGWLACLSVLSALFGRPSSIPISATSATTSTGARCSRLGRRCTWSGASPSSHLSPSMRGRR